MAAGWIPNRYPIARRSDHVDTYQSATSGAVHVPDPYNWLEQDSEETDGWISEQRDFARAYLDLYPDRKRLEDALRATINNATFDSPTLYDDERWYWSHNSGLQPQSVVYRSHDNILPEFKPKDDTEPGEVFFDPNVLSDDGTVSLTHFEISRSGEFLGYGLSQSGSDEITMYVRPTNAPLTKKDDNGRLPDEIKHVKFSDLSWAPDSKGFFYQRLSDAAPADANAMIFYHSVGTNQAEDILIHKDADHPTWTFGTTVTEDGEYLILQTSQDDGLKNLIWVSNFKVIILGEPIPWRKLFDSFDAGYSYVANDGPVFFFRTNKDAPQYKLISVDVSVEKPAPTIVIPEQKGVLLRTVQRVNGDRFVVRLKRNAKDELYIYDNNGKELERLFPDFIGTMIAKFPGTIAYYDFKNPDGQRLVPFRQIVIKGMNLDDFETSQVWFSSKDGTQVPMFITSHKSAPLDGTAPGIQFGYGGFGISVDPFFSPTHLTFIKIYGGIFVVVTVRGGGELGEDWHLAGARENKKNSFDDFIAATEYLVENKYVGPGKVALNGGSNGGLLVVASSNRAPQGTFGSVIAEVPVLDMLRFNKFTSGKSWVSDYGNPDDPKDFDFIYPISPLHNIPNQILPPTILSTADHDDRVVPMHSFKHAATLQYTHPLNPHPFLLRVDKDAGHGAGKSVEQRLQQDIDQWGFAAQSMGLEWKDE